MLLSCKRTVVKVPFYRVAVQLHQGSYSNEKYAERFVLSHELFKTRAETKQPPLIIHHGLLGSKSNWRAIGRNLNRSGRDVMILDLRNHGRSPHSNLMSYDILANDVVHTLKKILPSHRKFDLLGHSMGGKVAMVLALRRPELVSRAVIVDILPEYNASALRRYSADEISGDAIFDALENVSVDRSKPLPEAREGVVRQLLTKLNNDIKVCEWLATNLEWTPERGVFWKCNLKVLRSTLEQLMAFPEFKEEDFEPFKKPVLFIQGKKSNVMNSPKRDEVVRHFFPNAEFEAIQGAGHWVHHDKPFELIRSINSFLSSAPFS